MNGGDAKMLEMVIVTFLEPLVAITVCSGLVAPMATLPKLRLAGVIFRCAFPFEPCAKTGAGEARPTIKKRAKTENP